MQTTIQEIEVTVTELKEKVALADALDQLHRSPAFKKVILNGYFKDKAQDLVKLVALPQSEQQKDLIQNSMMGISALQNHFRAVYADGDRAKQDLAEFEGNAEVGEVGADV